MATREEKNGCEAGRVRLSSPALRAPPGVAGRPRRKPIVAGAGGLEVKTVIVVKVKKGEAIDKAVKRLKKAMDKEGIIKHLRDTRYFEKPCVRRRLKSVRARSRARSIARRQALAATLPRI